MYRLGAYQNKNFILPTSTGVLAPIVAALTGKKKCRCGGKCKGHSRSFPPKRVGMGSLVDDTSAPNFTDFSNATPFDSTVFNTPTFVANPTFPGAEVASSIYGGSSSAMPSWLSPFANIGAQTASLAIRNLFTPGAPKPVAPAAASSIFGSSQPGTIGGIPTNYLIYGGVALVVVSMLGSRRR